MANTVIGVFDNVRMAEDAAQELIYHGFNSNNVDISSTSETQVSKKEHKEGISRFFDNLFGDSDESRNYSEVGQRGAVVTVHTQSMDEADLASKILDQYGAVDANERGRSYRDMPDSDRGITNRDTTDRDMSATGMSDRDINRSDRDTMNTDDSLNVVEEQMEVGKRTVEGDTVRVRSRILEKPVEEHLRLRVEKVYIDRKPVDRKATEADMATFKEGTIEATEREEVPVVSKEARVVEEVKLRKDVEERDKAIRGSVRKQDVDVERDKKKRERKSSADEDAL